MAMYGASVNAGASPSRDGASIVDSGSTNTPGYRIEIRSDGTAAMTPQNRAGVAQGEAKTFSVESGVASRFFADLEKARAANVAGSPCMKSASFGTTTRVSLAWLDVARSGLSGRESAGERAHSRREPHSRGVGYRQHAGSASKRRRGRSDSRRASIPFAGAVTARALAAGAAGHGRRTPAA